MNFRYSTEATDYLKQKDKKLGEVIEKIGIIERAADTDLFASVIHHIVGQQISTKAQATIWQRINDTFGVLNADVILGAGIDRLQGFGITLWSVKMFSAMTIWPSGAACGWCTITGRLTGNVLSGTAGATVPIAVSRACTFGP